MRQDAASWGETGTGDWRNRPMKAVWPRRYVSPRLKSISERRVRCARSSEWTNNYEDHYHRRGDSGDLVHDPQIAVLERPFAGRARLAVGADPALVGGQADDQHQLGEEPGLGERV